MAESGVELASIAVPVSITPELKAIEDPALESSPDENPLSKRKLEELEPEEDNEAPLKKQEIEVDEGDEKSGVVEGIGVESANVDAEKSKDDDGGIDGAGIDGAEEAVKEVPTGEDDQLPLAQDSQTVSGPLTESSHRIEVPNSKVGVLIGKGGETIKFLQINSGAKVQITKDAEVDSQSFTRPVEILGTPEQVNKAEKLIRDVIAEAEAGGSASLIARGFGGGPSGGDRTEIEVPNEKVGLIIGKGGETIKSLQARSGARIQLIPQHLPEGDASKERVVRITGNKRQIETAQEMIKEAMNQIRSTKNYKNSS